MSRCFGEEDAAADTSISAEPLKDSFRPPLTQAVGILRETRIDQLVDRVALERLAYHTQQMPLPLAP
jgi:hypothetical protein